MEVVPHNAKGMWDWNGKTYYFCHPTCQEKFQANPEHYLSDPGATRLKKAPIPVGSTHRFACPMCPGIEAEKPGNCPRCGMPLERVGPFRLEEPSRIYNGKLISLSFAFLLWIPLLVEHVIPGFHNFHWFAALDSTVIVAGFGFPFLLLFFKSLWPGPWNMFTLVGMGVLASHALSIGALISPAVFGTHVYFESSAGIVVVMLAGQYLEAKLRQRAGTALRDLVHEIPRQARLVLPDLQEKDLPVELIQAGDYIRVFAGEKFPLDSLVLEGKSTVEESLITGEPFPREIKPGARIFAGSLNLSSPLLVKATAPGNECLIQKILQLVEEAQRTRFPIQNKVDVISRWMVPTVILLATTTFLIWHWVLEKPWPESLINSLSVLVIACPCALGLATPMAISVGLTRGAALGILVRRGEELEALCQVKTILFDKTGTLTEGKPRLMDTHSFGDFSQEEILAWAGSLGGNSSHPFSRELLSAAKEKQFSLPPFRQVMEFPGQGVSGNFHQGYLVMGRKDFLIQEGVTAADFNSWEGNQDPSSKVYLGMDGRLIGLFTFHDPIKPSTPEAIRLLKKENLRLIMLTGDNEAAGKKVAKDLGLDGCHAGLSPEEKAAWVDHYSEGGKIPVAMAGDGINDAAALSRARVSIAMGTGTDLAKETAGITLVQGNLMALAKARALAGFTTRAIWQNLALAFFYNIFALPLAACGFLSPMIAGLAMTCSSLSVLLNSLRLGKVSLGNPPCLFIK